ncbi:MAG: tRNA guanosine(34) transglycosylase Tgt [Bacteroidota bacterium]
MKFQIKKEDPHSSARTGSFTTAHGMINTPIFMPVGTRGTVKGIHQWELEGDLRAEIILGNTYHLYLRPGLEVIQQAGGLHPFMHWSLPILTDSGGYQVYSLADSRKITEEGVQFTSHIDGSKHTLTPESAINIQRIIGADIMMAFDECTPSECGYTYAKSAMELTHRWLKRCTTHFDQNPPLYGYPQYLFPIVQGSVYKDLRIQSATAIAEANQAGNAIGGVCHPTGQLYEVTGWVCDILPKHKPRYLMGVGTPKDILECIALGIDMFDCVMPARNGRNGYLFTTEGIIHIKNQQWRTDFSPIDVGLAHQASRYYSKAYLHHLLRVGERLGGQIATLHNLAFYRWLIEESRKHITTGTFRAWKDKMIPTIMRKI